MNGKDLKLEEAASVAAPWTDHMSVHLTPVSMRVTFSETVTAEGDVVPQIATMLPITMGPQIRDLFMKMFPPMNEAN